MLKSEELIAKMVCKFNPPDEMLEYIKMYKNALEEEYESKYGNVERIVIINERELNSLVDAIDNQSANDNQVWGVINGFKSRLFYPKKKGK